MGFNSGFKGLVFKFLNFEITECTVNFDTFDLFFGRPDDDSIQSKHVAIRIFCVINRCV